MKNLSTLSLVLITMLTTVQPLGAWNFDFPTLTDVTEYEGKYAPVAVPSVVASDGTIYQTGLYDDITIIGDNILENIATSAYVAAIDRNTHLAKWAIGIKGAAYISHIATDGTNLYVAGKFADDVVFGTTSGEEKSFTGVAESHDMVNGFVAKYTTGGALVGVLPIYPHANSRYADRYTEGSDLTVNITSMALLNGKVYVGLAYKGGYTAGTINKDGNLFSGDGLVYDALCLGVLAWDGTSVTNPLTFMGDKDVMTSNYGPFSLNLAADAEALHVGIFASNSNMLTVNGAATMVSFDEDVYGACLVRISDRVTTKTFTAAKSERYYINNLIKKMQVNDGKLYISGSVATPLPFDDSLVPDLWTDQFAACLDAASYATQWAVITGAKREDISTINGKYRETTDAILSDGNYIVVGAANFVCNAAGQKSDLNTGDLGLASDYILGLSADSESLALTTKTATGSQLTVVAPLADAVESVETPAGGEVESVYSIDGVRRATIQKGVNIVKYSDGSVKKQISK